MKKTPNPKSKIPNKSQVQSPKDGRRAVFAGAILLLGACGTTAPRTHAPDWEHDGQEAVELLQKLIRFDTINPPQPESGRKNADETALLRWVQRLLADEGVASEIFESSSGRGNLVARIPGNGGKRPLLLMAHVDVVSVDPRFWDAPPLSGEIRNGTVWGRGALDDKGMAAVAVEVVRILARRRPALARDVVLMLNADEESGGNAGAQFMVERHWDRIECEFVLNEGGRIALAPDGKLTQVGFSAGEKIYTDFRLWVPGASGHSSTPRLPNSIYDASRMLAKLETFETPIRVTPTTAAYLAAVADRPDNAPHRELMRAAAAGDVEAATRLAAKRPDLNSVLRTTVVPTVVKGGIRVNVLPPSVEVNFNARLLPGEKLRDLIAAMAKHAGLESYDVLEAKDFEKWLAGKSSHPAFVVDTEDADAPASPVECEAVAAIRTVSKRLAPEAPVVPTLLTGATDSRFFREKGVACYGIYPCPTTDEERGSVHDHNERVRVDSVKWGVRWLYEIVIELSR